MQAFTEHFDVDMEGFYWLRYFGDEGWDMLAPVLIGVARFANREFEHRWRAARAEEREITIAHLVDVAEAKHWTHPGPEHRSDHSADLVTVVLVTLGAAAPLAFAAFAMIALYGLVTGEVSDQRLLALAVVVGAATFPLVLAIASWRNIRRKLASAGS